MYVHVIFHMYIETLLLKTSKRIYWVTYLKVETPVPDFR